LERALEGIRLKEVDDARSSSVQTASADGRAAIGGREPGRPVSTAVPSVEERDGGPQNKLVLALTCGSHGIDHFQQHILSILYTVIMVELGFGYAQLGILQAVRTSLGSAFQVVYGFLARLAPRSRLLAAGNIISGLATLLTGLAGSFTVLLGTRTLFSLGSSAQHPVGSSILAGQFPRNRGTVLALNSSMAGLGGLLAPAAAGLLADAIGWRLILIVGAFASLAIGGAFLFLRTGARRRGSGSGSRMARLAGGKASYWRVLRNRNMMVISMVMMVGAGGRGDGIDTIYLGPHLVNDLGLTLALAGLALSTLNAGHIAGALGLGWLSDRLPRTWVLQGSLLLSALASWWLANQGAFLPVLLANIFIYGTVTGARNTLTQAFMADSLADEDRDAAFSVYYFIGFVLAPMWALTTGFIMQEWGFSTAFFILGFSYVAGMLLFFLVDDPARKVRTMDD
jgi:MFS family permease